MFDIFKGTLIDEIVENAELARLSCYWVGDMTRLPKSKFSAKFLKGLRRNFTNTDLKNQNYLISYVQNYRNRKSVGGQLRTTLKRLLVNFVYKLYGNRYAVYNASVSGR